MMGAAKILGDNDTLVQPETVAADDFPNRDHSESVCTVNGTTVKRKDCKPPMSIFETLSEELDLPLNETSDPPAFKKAKIDLSSSPSIGESSPADSFFTAHSNGSASEESEEKESLEVSKKLSLENNESPISDTNNEEKTGSEVETKELKDPEEQQDGEDQKKELTVDGNKNSNENATKFHEAICDEKSTENLDTKLAQELAVDKDTTKSDFDDSKDGWKPEKDDASMTSLKGDDATTEKETELPQPVTDAKDSEECAEVSSAEDNKPSQVRSSDDVKASESTAGASENGMTDAKSDDVDQQTEETETAEMSEVSSFVSTESEQIAEVNPVKEAVEQTTEQSEAVKVANQEVPQIGLSPKAFPESQDRFLSRKGLCDDVAETTKSSSVVFLSGGNSPVSTEISNAAASIVRTASGFPSLSSITSATIMRSFINYNSFSGPAEEPVDSVRQKQIEKVVDLVATDFLNTSAYQYLNARQNSESSELMDNFLIVNGLREDYIEEIGFVDYASSVGKSTPPLVSDEPLRELMESEGDLSAGNPFAVWAPEEMEPVFSTPVQDVSNALASNSLPKTVSNGDVPNSINVPVSSNFHFQSTSCILPVVGMVPTTQVPNPVVDSANFITNSETLVSALPDVFIRSHVSDETIVAQPKTSAMAIKGEPDNSTPQENFQDAVNFLPVRSQVTDTMAMSVHVQSDVCESSASCTQDQRPDLASLSQHCTEVIKFSMRQYRQSWLRKGASGCQRIERDQTDESSRWGTLLTLLEQKLNVQTADFGCQMSSSHNNYPIDVPPNRSQKEIPILSRNTTTSNSNNNSYTTNPTIRNQSIPNQQSESSRRSFTTSGVNPNSNPNIVDYQSGQIVASNTTNNSPANKQFALVQVVKSNTPSLATSPNSSHRPSPVAAANIIKRGRGRPPRSHSDMGTEVKKLPTLGVRPKAAAATNSTNVQLSNLPQTNNLPLSSTSGSPYLVVPLQTITSSSPSQNTSPMYQVVMANNANPSFDRMLNNPMQSNMSNQRLPDNNHYKETPSAGSPRRPELMNSHPNSTKQQQQVHSDLPTNVVHSQKPANHSQIIDLVSDDDDEQSNVSSNSSNNSAPNRFLPQNNSHLLLNSNSNYRNALEKQRQQRRRRNRFNRSDFLLPVTDEIEKMSNSVEAASHDLPPKLYLSANPTENNNNNNNRGITLIWKMFVPKQTNCKILKYELMANTGGGSSTSGNSGWVLVDSIDPLVLPMQCSLTNLNPGVIHFAIRGLDVFKRAGDYSNVVSVSIPKQVSQTSK